ncbi:hypothetical protein AAVH_18670 [Aphelenchoides avenae]|nr:hypothetical protein AAVH_18670 [Aphelenchus avenae]
MLLITLIETLTDIFALLPRVDVDALQITCRLFRETVDRNLLRFAWRIVEAAAIRDRNNTSYVADMVPGCEPVPGMPTRTLEFRGRLRDRIRSVFQALQWARVDTLGLLVYKPKPVTDDMAKIIMQMSSTIVVNRLSIPISGISPATLNSLIHSFHELREVRLWDGLSSQVDDVFLQVCAGKGVQSVLVPKKPMDGARCQITTEGILSFMLGSRNDARCRKLEIYSFESDDNFVNRLIEAFRETHDIDLAELVVHDFPKNSQNLEDFEDRIITEVQDQRHTVFFDVHEQGFLARISFETHQPHWLSPQPQSLLVRFTNDADDASKIL